LEEPLAFAVVRRYLTFVRTRVSTKGQIVLPAELRERDGIAPGQEFEVERLDADEYRLRRVTPPPNDGLVDWLLSCPERGYFVAIDSESTDTL
jgi:AbrB family looped-hinge helix DNA binding protein